MERRLNPKRAWSDQPEPIMTGSNALSEMAAKSREVICAGIGAVHMMVNKIGLREDIDGRLHLLKRGLEWMSSGRCLAAEADRLLPGNPPARKRKL